MSIIFHKNFILRVKTQGDLVLLRVLDLSMHLETYSAYDFGVKGSFAPQTTNPLIAHLCLRSPNCAW